jgi:hypothetical protein
MPHGWNADGVVINGGIAIAMRADGIDAALEIDRIFIGAIQTQKPSSTHASDDHKSPNTLGEWPRIGVTLRHTTVQSQPTVDEDYL